jgi:long-chain acyl-CoA synthetase
MEASQDLAMKRDDPIVFAGCDTPQKLFRARAREWGAATALRYKRRGIWHSIAWREYYANARACGFAFLELGVAVGEVVTVLAENRPEWLYADCGARSMGMIGNGIYPTSSPEQVEYVLHDSRTRVIMVENEEQLDKVLAVRKRCPHLAKIVTIDPKGLRKLRDEQVITFDALIAIGEKAAARDAPLFDAMIDRGRPEDICFLVYTSGTTGRPKGAMISNRNIMFQITHVPEVTKMGRGDKTLSFLPLCHIAERVTTCFTPLYCGNIVHFPESSVTVVNDMREVEPQFVFAPPRFWEKLYSQIELFLRDATAPAQYGYARAIAAGNDVAALRLAGQPIPAGLATRFRIWQMLALSNVRRSLGLGRIRNAITGAAPVAPDLIRWYMAIGVDLLEAFGMTETSGLCTATPPDRIKLGSAGVAASGAEVRIGPEDEILVRGANVFCGYWNQPEQTSATIDAEGWLHTGDVGELDADGALRIKDRLKDIIITSGGKNITPSSIENQLKLSPYISDAMVIGEAKRFVTCLVMIDQDNVAQFAQDRQVSYTDFASLTRAREVVDLVRAEIEAVNRQLARVEQLKDFRIIDQLLTAEDEELTPTMKLKRRVVAAKYNTLIASMYASD